MALETPDYDALKARYLQAVANQLPQAAVGADSDHAVRASAVAATVESLHQHVWWLSRQLFADTAEVDYLERLATQYGVQRKPPAVATGTVTVSGTAGATVEQGLQLQTAGGALYALTASAVVGGGGSVNVPASALVGGSAGNLAVGTTLTLSNPGVGLAAGAVVVTMTGGDEAETDASLRDRLLSQLRDAPAGGSASDYRRWALEVAGVDRAFVFGARRGLGTVDVVVMTADGLPTTGLIEEVEDHLDTRRPVTADLLVLMPDLVTVNVVADVVLHGVLLANAQAAARAAIAAYVQSLAPGATVYRSRLIAAIQDVPGVVTVDVTTPAADVETTVDALTVELAELGTVTLNV